jgi:hypothetical protein
MTAETVPVTVAEDAAARLAALAIQPEFEQILDHAREAVPHLRQLRVTLEYDPERPLSDPGVVIWAHREAPPTT